MTGRCTATVRAAMNEGRLAGSNKSGRWMTTRQAVADWLGVELEEIRPYAPVTTGQVITSLVSAVHSGQLPVARLDSAVQHVLRAKGRPVCG